MDSTILPMTAVQQDCSIPDSAATERPVTPSSPRVRLPRETTALAKRDVSPLAGTEQPLLQNTPSKPCDGQPSGQTISWYEWFASALASPYSLFSSAEQTGESPHVVTEPSDVDAFETQAELITDDEIKEITRESVKTNIASVMPNLPTQWQSVMVKLLSKSSKSPAYAQQASKELFKYYQASELAIGVTQFNRDLTNLNTIYDGLKTAGRVESCRQLGSILKKLSHAFQVWQHFHKYSGNSDTYSSNHPKLIRVSQASLQKISEIATFDNHIVGHFNEDMKRNMNVSAYSPKGGIDFFIKTLNGEYSFNALEDSSVIAQLHFTSISDAELDRLTSACHQSIIDCSIECAKRRLESSPGPVASFTDRAEVVSEEGDEDQEVERLYAALTTAISDLATQTSGNCLLHFVNQLYAMADSMISPVDHSYWTDFDIQEDGCVIARLYFQCDRYQLAFEGQIYQVNQQVSVKTDIVLDPANLDQRKFGDVQIDFGCLSSVDLI